MMEAEPVNSHHCKIAIIGGTGVADINGFVRHTSMEVNTHWGTPSTPLVNGELNGVPLVFLARHGANHSIPPHKINYRANIQALYDEGITHIIAIAAVGGITDALTPSRLAFPHQLIDYTHSREHTFYNGQSEGVEHIDFTRPYCESLRGLMVDQARVLNLDAIFDGVYAATQGPRLETTAEIDRLERDGCSMVGMTGMPEAALARELGLCYATCAVVANRAAGRGPEQITMQDVQSAVATGIEQVEQLLKAVLPVLITAGR